MKPAYLDRASAAPIWRALFRRLFAGVFCLLLLTGPAMAQDTADGGLSMSLRSQTPLYTPPCHSPRQTMAEFQRLAREIAAVFLSGGYPGDVTWSRERKLIELYARLTYLMDMHQLPGEDRFAVANIAATQLSEVLDRLRLPPLKDIPGREQVERENLHHWRLPHHAEISLTRVDKGIRQGDWLFSAGTVARVGTLYERVRAMPYQPGANVGKMCADGGLMGYYMAYTGPMIPPGFVGALPRWLKAPLWGDPLWKLLASLLLVALVIGLAVIVARITSAHGPDTGRPPKIRHYLLRLVLPLSMAAMVWFGLHFITVDIRLRLLPVEVLDGILWFALCLIAFWLCVCLGNLVAAVVIALPSISPVGLDASLVRLCTRILSYFAGLWIIFEGVQRMGLSLVPLIAGISVGGLAVALAARPTLGNLLAGVLIFADKPFSVGQRVVINNHDGNVEEIGLRSTRIRTLDGHQVTVPNEEVCNNSVTNVARRPNIRRNMNLTVTYDTPPEKIERAMEIVRQLLSVEEDRGKSEQELGRPSNSRINGNPDFQPRVSFNKLNADSLNILAIYWFEPPDYWAYLDHATWVNLQLIERFGAEKIDFAFPTQTIELETVSKEPDQAAEDQPETPPDAAKEEPDPGSRAR